MGLEPVIQGVDPLPIYVETELVPARDNHVVPHPPPPPPPSKKKKEEKWGRKSKRTKIKTREQRAMFYLVSYNVALLHFFFFKQPANYTNFN